MCEFMRGVGSFGLNACLPGDGVVERKRREAIGAAARVRALEEANMIVVGGEV